MLRLFWAMIFSANFSWMRQKYFGLLICWHVSVVVVVTTNHIAECYEEPERYYQLEQLSREFVCYVTIYLANVFLSLNLRIYFFSIIQNPPQASVIRFLYLNAPCNGNPATVVL